MIYIYILKLLTAGIDGDTFCDNYTPLNFGYVWPVVHTLMIKTTKYWSAHTCNLYLREDIKTIQMTEIGCVWVLVAVLNSHSLMWAQFCIESLWSLKMKRHTVITVVAHVLLQAKNVVFFQFIYFTLWLKSAIISLLSDPFV